MGLASGVASMREGNFPLTSERPRSVDRKVLWQRKWIGATLFILAGYIFFDKGFAYVGIPPVFISEVVLFLGLVAALVPGSVRQVRSSPTLWCWAAWSALCLFRTLPYLGTEGLDAVRDAALYWYGLYAVLFGAALLRWNYMGEVLRKYMRIVPIFMLWAAAGMLIQLILPVWPKWPGTTVPIMMIKGGDLGVHWGGAMVATLLGFQALARDKKLSNLAEGFTYLCWFAVIIVTGSINRSGLVSGLAAMLLLALLPVRTRMLRFAALGMLVGAMIVVSAPFLGSVTNLSGTGRNLSVDQVATNLESVFVNTGQANLNSTEQWRKNWWTKIVAETIHGPYFWAGKGFGYNLSRDNFPTAGQEDKLRSPHSAHMTVLARTGVPGLLLWTILHVVFFSSILRYFFLSRRQGDTWRCRIYAWIACYWVGFILNSSLDVFLEGPQGAIPFWCLVGFGVAMMEQQKREIRISQLDKRRQMLAEVMTNTKEAAAVFAS